MTPTHEHDKPAKLPAFQIYPGDFWKDPGVKLLNCEERGCWLQLLLVMHETDRRGYLSINGKPMPTSGLAAMLGVPKTKIDRLIRTILEYGVASRDEATGAIFSRRMVRDEAVRQERKRCGSLGGNPNLVNREVNQIPNPGVKVFPTPSSSVSISTSVSSSIKETPTPLEKPEAKQTALPGAAPAELGGTGDSSESEASKKSKKPVEPIMIPDVLAEHQGFAEAWESWQQYRREINKPLAPSTRNSQLVMLARHGPVKAIAMLKTSITNGWTGLFPDDATNGRKSGKDTRPACILNPTNTTNLF